MVYDSVGKSADFHEIDSDHLDANTAQLPKCVACLHSLGNTESVYKHYTKIVTF